jgi:hypothetical protein
MKNIALVVLSIATAVFASLYLSQTGKVIKAETATETLHQQVNELATTMEEQGKKSEELRAEVEQVRKEAAAKEREIVQLRAASTNSGRVAMAPTSGSAPKEGAKPENPFSAFSKIFDDPEMKEAIALQQKAALGSMLDKTYGKLFTDLRLSPEQTTALKEMLLNKQMAGAEMGMSMLSEGMDLSKSEELGQKVKAASDAADAEIKAFLGDEKFAQLKEYEKTSADRMALSGFKDQLSANAALSPEQEQQLIEVMTKARQEFKFTTDFSNKSSVPGDFTAMFNEENVNRFIQEMDQLNQNFVSHSQNILTPDQLVSFQKYLNNQQALQKVGMQMGAKMFAPGNKKNEK